MTEQEKGKVIDFSSRKVLHAGTPVEPTTPSPTEGRLTPFFERKKAREEKSGIIIPSLGEMYDTTIVTYSGVPVEDMMRKASESMDPEIGEPFLFKMETRLLDERAMLIAESIHDKKLRNLPIRDLLKYTLDRAEDLAELTTDDYRQKLRNRVIQLGRIALGDFEMGKLLENHGLRTTAHELHRPNTEPKTPTNVTIFPSKK